jgi:hypothetical protein
MTTRADTIEGFYKKRVKPPLIGRLKSIKRGKIGPICRKLRYNNIKYDPLQVYWISPEMVSEVTTYQPTGQPGSYHLDAKPIFGPKKQWDATYSTRWGTTIGGEWDLNTVPFDNLSVAKSAEQRISEEIPWSETEIFERHAERIKKGYTSSGCSTLEKLRHKYDNIERVFQSIQEDGYLSSKQLFGAYDPYREIIVNIGRSGSVLFNGGGRHRLAIAKSLGIQEIPVVVLVRHKRLLAPE